MENPESIFMINELLYNLEGNPINEDSPYLVHLVDYCMVSVRTEKSERDFLFQDMLVIPINPVEDKNSGYILASEKNLSLTLPFKVQEGYTVKPGSFVVGEVEHTALKAQYDNLTSGNTIFVGDNYNGTIFKPSDIAELTEGMDSAVLDQWLKAPVSEKARTYFLGLEKDSLKFHFSNGKTNTEYQFTFLSDHKTMYKRIEEIDSRKYISGMN